MSTTKKLKLPPFSMGLDNEVEEIREAAIERQTASGGRARRGRVHYDSDIRRWERTITITLPNRADIEWLEEAAARLGQENGVAISRTKLATLIMVAAVDLLKRGKLELVSQSREVEQLAIRVIGDEA